MKLEVIKNFLNLKNFEYLHYDIVDSTMEEVKRKLNNKNLCIVANQQTQGIGRRGNAWISPKGNIYMSFLINYDLDYKNHFIYNAAITNSVCSLVDYFCKIETNIKWPNDILINNSKVSGIMSELFKKESQTYIILGVGINFASSPVINNYPTTNIKNYAKNISKNHTIYKLINFFFDQYADIKSNNYDKIILSYKSKLFHLGKNVNIEEENNKKTNILFEDINLDGSIVANINGVRKKIYSGRIINDIK